MPRLTRPRLSLHARLIAIAAITSIAALAFAAFSIGEVLERFVMRGMDHTLDTQVLVLADALDSDGRLDPKHVVELQAFKRGWSGWNWRVRTAAGQWKQGDADLRIDALWQPRGRGDIVSAEGADGTGRPLHFRLRRWMIAGEPAEVLATAPRAILNRPLMSALPALLVSLGLLGVALALATWAQLRYGLRPLRALGQSVAQVRSGAAHRLPLDQPRELKPVAEEINALIAQNEAGLEHARGHLANLAHGLKTPLATLSLQLARENASPEARALVDQLDTRIAHHLRRARSAAPGGAARTQASITEVAGDLIDALRHIHAERGLRLSATVAPDLTAAIDRQDLDEILGNLLDNACRHAAGEIRLTATAAGALASIRIEDDGPGLTDQQVVEALRPGARLDESGTGYGFGLAITRELVELYGGTLTLGRSARLGGLCAEVALARR
jgi:signal transduction histidine kinase